MGSIGRSNHWPGQAPALRQRPALAPTVAICATTLLGAYRDRLGFCDKNPANTGSPGNQTLVARYAWHAARAESEPLARLFTEDGLFISPSAQPPAGTLAQFYATHLKRGYTIPLVTNHIIEIDVGTARGCCTMLSPWQGDGPGFCGFYEDDYRREGSEWRFARRVVKYHQPHHPPGATPLDLA
jgi:hypothetical protein